MQTEHKEFSSIIHPKYLKNATVKFFYAKLHSTTHSHNNCHNYNNIPASGGSKRETQGRGPFWRSFATKVTWDISKDIANLNAYLFVFTVDSHVLQRT